MKKALNILLLIALVFASTSADAQRRKKKKDKGVSYETQRQITELFFQANKEKMLGNYEEAGGLFHECIKLDPNNSTAYYELAGLLTAKDLLADALPFALRAYELEPQNQWYALFAADIQMGLGDYKSASRMYLQLTERFPENVDYQYELATTYLYLNELENNQKVVG